MAPWPHRAPNEGVKGLQFRAPMGQHARGAHAVTMGNTRAWAIASRLVYAHGKSAKWLPSDFTGGVDGEVIGAFVVRRQNVPIGAVAEGSRVHMRQT